MKKTVVIHPLLFAVYPVLFLYSHNIDLAPLGETLRAFVVTLGTAALLWIILSFVLKNKKKAGLIVSLFFILFFSYAHVDELIGKFTFIVGAVSIGKSKILFAICVASLTLFTYVITRTHMNLTAFTKGLNITGGLLVGISFLNVVLFGNELGSVSSINLGRNQKISNHREIRQNDAPAHLPDIYYIILDGYARADILKDTYLFDNSDFLNHLEQKGFYIAYRSRSNYAQTMLSLASSLNSKYLDNLASHIEPTNHDLSNISLNKRISDFLKIYSNRRPLLKMIQNNMVVNFLSAYGYRHVVFTSGYGGVEIPNADIVMNSKWMLNEFENILLNTTPLPDVLSKLYDPWDSHRGRIFHILDNLPNTTKFKSPVFVFAHILCPHPPFVFTIDGKKVDHKTINPNRYFTYSDGVNPSVGLYLNEYVQRYREQLVFLNKRIEEAIDEIIANSKEAPIIILQSDHGPSAGLASDLSNPNSDNMRERMAILNAYYIPRGHEGLYDEISPVNTFRIILNEYFNANFDLLKDESYFSTWDSPYRFVNVDNFASFQNL